LVPPMFDCDEQSAGELADGDGESGGGAVKALRSVQLRAVKGCLETSRGPGGTIMAAEAPCHQTGAEQKTKRWAPRPHPK